MPLPVRGALSFLRTLRNRELPLEKILNISTCAVRVQVACTAPRACWAACVFQCFLPQRLPAISVSHSYVWLKLYRSMYHDAACGWEPESSQQQPFQTSEMVPNSSISDRYILVYD